MCALILRSCSKINNFYFFRRHHSCLSSAICKQKAILKSKEAINEKFSPFFSKLVSYSPQCTDFSIATQRYYSKKKKSKQHVQENEESDEEEEEYESLEQDEIGDAYNLFTKSVPSLRLDSIMKAGLGITKKKVEKEFYANRIRQNGEKVLKKAAAVYSGDEIDLIKGYSPDNSNFLLVDRVVVKSVGKITKTGNYPVQMQVLKSLTIENYSEPWSKSNILDD